MSSLQKFAQEPPGPLEEARNAASIRGMICDCTSSACLELFSRRLQAIVLTGSMARDEASLIRKAECWHIAGDAEFMLAFNESANLPATEAIGALRERIEAQLRERNIWCHVDLSAVHPSYFQRLPPHIFSYEMKHRGRVIWGNERILQTIPDYSVDDLSREDAWRLLCNRLIEALECAPEFSEEGPSSGKVQYRIAKLYLDMATSLLVFLRAYAPSYRERREIIRHLAEQNAPANEYPFDLANFAERVGYCTDQKITGGASAERPVDFSWRAAVRTAYLLWRWELTRLADEKKTVSDLELFDKWAHMQPLRERIRGWLYVLRARGWHRSYREWPRWLRLCRRGSPRYLIYLAACTLLFQEAGEANASGGCGNKVMTEGALAELLPVRGIKSEGHGRSSWNGLASDIAGNYHEFLAGTRA